MHYTWALRYEFGRNSHNFCERSAGESSFGSEIYEDKFQEVEKSEVLSETGSHRVKSINVKSFTAKYIYKYIYIYIFSCEGLHIYT